MTEIEFANLINDSGGKAYLVGGAVRDKFRGVLNLAELREKAKIDLISTTSIVEGGSHDVILRDRIRD